MKTETFTADECQALLDYIERLERNALPVNINKEEADAMNKLRKAGEFYMPELAEEGIE